jgi:hypothetical protein
MQVSLDDYFDQLDAAFSNIDTSERAGAAPDRPAPTPAASAPDNLHWALNRPPDAPEVEKPSGLTRTPGAGPNEFEWIAKHAAEASGAADLDFSGLTDVAPKPVEVAASPAAPVWVSEPAAPGVVHQPTAVAQVPSTPARPVVPPVESSPKPKVTFDEPSVAVSETPRPVVSVPMADAFMALLAAEQGETLTIPGRFLPPAAAGHVAITDELVERVSERVLSRLSDVVVRETVRDTVSRVADRLVRDEIDRIKRTGRLSD